MDSWDCWVTKDRQAASLKFPSKEFCLLCQSKDLWPWSRSFKWDLILSGPSVSAVWESSLDFAKRSFCWPKLQEEFGCNSHLLPEPKLSFLHDAGWKFPTGSRLQSAGDVKFCHQMVVLVFSMGHNQQFTKVSAYAVNLFFPWCQMFKSKISLTVTEWMIDIYQYFW